MFALIITVISIALVAAVAMATLYYGGAAFSKGSATAEAAKILNQGQQLLGAAEMFRAQNGRWPHDIPEMVSAGFLKSVPSASVPMGEALAATSQWTTVKLDYPVYTVSTTSPQACQTLNAETLGTDGVPLAPFDAYTVQCYGTTSSTLTTVASKPTALTSAGVEVTSGTVATASADSWLMAPLAAVVPAAPAVPTVLALPVTETFDGVAGTTLDNKVMSGPFLWKSSQWCMYAPCGVFLDGSGAAFSQSGDRASGILDAPIGSKNYFVEFDLDIPADIGQRRFSVRTRIPQLWGYYWQDNSPPETAYFEINSPRFGGPSADWGDTHWQNHDFGNGEGGTANFPLKGGYMPRLSGRHTIQLEVVNATATARVDGVVVSTWTIPGYNSTRTDGGRIEFALFNADGYPNPAIKVLAMRMGAR